MGVGVIFLMIIAVGVLISSKRSNKLTRCRRKQSDVYNPSISIIWDQSKNNVETSSDINI